MKKIVTMILLVYLLLILDNTLIPMLSIRGYYPTVLFVFIICYSIINGTKEAMIIGSLTGLFQDVYFYNGIGLNAFINLVVCVLAAEIGKKIIKKKSFIPVISSFFFSIFRGILLFALLFIMGQYINSRMILYTSVYNMVVSIFMYKPVFKLCEMKFMKKEWRF